MGLIKLLTAPIRSIVRFPLFQFAVVVAVILWLQAADDKSALGAIFFVLDRLVDATVSLISAFFAVKSFTRSWLISGFMIAYVYLACWLILSLVSILTRIAVDIVGRTNMLWLRNTIARERGIEAYRAWEPFERIRPDSISQETWEERFAWPADNRPPYLPLAQRILRATMVYGGCIIVAVVLLQVLTPFPVGTWIVALARRLFG